MKIVCAVFKYDYADPRRGHSFEHMHFWGTISKMYGRDAVHFPVDENIMRMGKRAMNKALLETVRREKPDLLFCNLFTNEINPGTIKKITRESGIITVNWFSDDQWRFDNFSRYWAPLFDWVVTTDPNAVEKYKKIGYDGAIKSTWAANTGLYRPVPSKKSYGVTFVGSSHGSRLKMVNFLKENGITVECWGQGWPNGRATQDEMIEIFGNSKINLNFTEVSTSARDLKTMMKTVAKVFLRRGISNMYHFFPPSIIFRNMINFNLPRAYPQIKGRNFEVPACGGFMITQEAEDLFNYYEYNKEIVIFNTPEEMLEKVKYYLDHNVEREKIARAGYERTIRDHTWEKRFSNIFEEVIGRGKRSGGQFAKIKP